MVNDDFHFIETNATKVYRAHMDISKHCQRDDKTERFSVMEELDKMKFQTLSKFASEL